jgi:thiol-disulfide isomerase/thioredoxin
LGLEWNTSLFLSDATILINGNIKDESFNGIKFGPNIKLVSSPKILGGKQTEAYYNIDSDLFENINSKTIEIIREKIKQFPYYYQLLYKIDENKNSFSADQVADFLKLFKGEITKSETYKKLYDYNQKSFLANKINLPRLENMKGEKKTILDSKYNKHLIIFWASCCGPCRTEIPLLKKIYIKEKDKVELISISTDTDKKTWENAINV